MPYAEQGSMTSRTLTEMVRVGCGRGRGRGRGKTVLEVAAAEIIAGIRAGKGEIFVGKSKQLRLIVALSSRLASLITRRW